MLSYLDPYIVKFSLFTTLVALSLTLYDKGIYLLDRRELQRP
jgi:hypothetical protein